MKLTVICKIVKKWHTNFAAKYFCSDFLAIIALYEKNLPFKESKQVWGRRNASAQTEAGTCLYMGVGGAEWSMRRGVKGRWGGSTGLRLAGGCSPARVWKARGPAPCSLPANAHYTAAETAPALPEEGSTREEITHRQKER